MSKIRALRWSDVDSKAMLGVEESMTPGSRFVIGGITPVKTGFGVRLHVPATDEQMEEDPGSFLELTYEQAVDLNAKLAVKLAEAAKGMDDR